MYILQFIQIFISFKVGNELINAESATLLKIITPGLEKTMKQVHIDIVDGLFKSVTLDELFL